MIFAYLIMAHDSPAQLDALLDRLLPVGTEDFAVVHFDAKSHGWRGGGVLRGHYPGHGDSSRVIMIDRPVAVHWGHATQLGATLALLSALQGRAFDMAHLISGSDWPVAPRAAIVESLSVSQAQRSALPCSIEASGTEQGERMGRYWLHDRFLNPRVEGSVAYRAACKLLRAAGPIADRALGPRPLEYGEPWRKGSSWWSLPRDACELVAVELARLQRSGRLRFTACSDEHVIQSIVAHHFPNRIAGNRRFIRWTGGSSPAVLGRDDLPAIAASDAWFARKFDMRVDDAFLTAFPTSAAKAINVSVGTSGSDEPPS